MWVRSSKNGGKKTKTAEPARNIITTKIKTHKKTNNHDRQTDRDRKSFFHSEDSMGPNRVFFRVPLQSILVCDSVSLPSLPSVQLPPWHILSLVTIRLQVLHTVHTHLLSLKTALKQRFRLIQTNTNTNKQTKKGKSQK